MSAVGLLAQSLTSILEKGIKCDSWGQRLEAAREYDKFMVEYDNGCVNLSSSDAHEKQIAQVIRNVRHRSKQLTVSECVRQLNTQTQIKSHQLEMSVNDVSLDQIKSDVQVFKEVLMKFQTALKKRHSSVVAECGENYLLPTPKKTSGLTYLTIKIEKIGLKDADAYVDPFITISVRELSAVQHTPPSYHVQGQYLIFDLNVHIPTALQDLSAVTPDFAVFLELRHYKEKEDKVSTRCFAFVEPDEIKMGAAVVELYKKPADYARKKLYLFTEKPLYLHLNYLLEKA